MEKSIINIDQFLLINLALVECFCTYLHPPDLPPAPDTQYLPPQLPKNNIQTILHTFDRQIFNIPFVYEN